MKRAYFLYLIIILFLVLNTYQIYHTKQLNNKILLIQNNLDDLNDKIEEQEKKLSEHQEIIEAQKNLIDDMESRVEDLEYN